MKRLFDTEYLGTFIMYIYIHFHMPGSNGSSVIGIKLITICNLCGCCFRF